MLYWTIIIYYWLLKNKNKNINYLALKYENASYSDFS